MDKILIDNPITGKRETLTQSQFYSYMAQTNRAILNYVVTNKIQKHGEHDQSDHGSWASGNFNEETEYEGVAQTYGERYGIDKDGNKTGVTASEHDAIDRYSQNGYKQINEYLRGLGKKELDPDEAKLIVENNESLYLSAIDEYSGNNEVGSELTEAELEDAIFSYTQNHADEILEVANSGGGNFPIGEMADSLGALIEKSPSLFGDKTLYRVYDDKVLEGLREGDVVTDKGFMSTTRIDVTKEENSSARTWMSGIKETSDTVGIILPSASKSGKGLAVDIYRTSVVDSSTVSDTEKEILLPRNTSLKFIRYKTDVGTEARVAVFQRLDK